MEEVQDTEAAPEQLVSEWSVPTEMSIGSGSSVATEITAVSEASSSGGAYGSEVGAPESGRAVNSESTPSEGQAEMSSGKLRSVERSPEQASTLTSTLPEMDLLLKTSGIIVAGCTAALILFSVFIRMRKRTEVITNSTSSIDTSTTPAASTAFRTTRYPRTTWDPTRTRETPHAVNPSVTVERIDSLLAEVLQVVRGVLGLHDIRTPPSIYARNTCNITDVKILHHGNVHLVPNSTSFSLYEEKPYSSTVVHYEWRIKASVCTPGQESDKSKPQTLVNCGSRGGYDFEGRIDLLLPTAEGNLFDLLRLIPPSGFEIACDGMRVIEEDHRREARTLLRDTLEENMREISSSLIEPLFQSTLSDVQLRTSTSLGMNDASSP